MTKVAKKIKEKELKKLKDKSRIVSSKVSKFVKKKDPSRDSMYRFLSSFFDKELSEAFGKFLQERAQVIPISSAKKKDAVRMEFCGGSLFDDEIELKI